MSVLAAIVVDAPRPVPPLYTLLGAPITDASPPADEHWASGLELIGYPTVAAMGVWPLCPPDASSAMADKQTGDLAASDRFQAFTIYLGLRCTSRSFNVADLTQRAQVAYEAYEHYPLERQVLNGYYEPDIPHLSDTNASVITATAQKVTEGFALLEEAIAKTGRAGVIHCSPQLLTEAAAAKNGLILKVGNHLETYLGTTVIPAQGYWEASAPVGQVGNAGTAEWAYASTPFIVRRGDIFIPSEQPVWAVDRSTNDVTVWVERDYVYAFDQVLQAAVKIDRAT